MGEKQLSTAFSSLPLYRFTAHGKIIISEDDTFSGESTIYPSESTPALDLSTPEEEQCIMTPDPCDEEPAIVSKEGTLCLTPDGSTYPRNAKCAWTISAPTGYVSNT